MTHTVDINETENIYEIGYLLAPTVPEQEAEEIEENLHDALADGEVLTSKSPEMRELAYEIEVKTETDSREFARAQFGWVQFTYASESVDDVKEIFEKEDDVIRYLLITIDEDEIHDEDEESESVEDDDEDAESDE